jgi:hypothetical protein
VGNFVDQTPMTPPVRVASRSPDGHARIADSTGRIICIIYGCDDERVAKTIARYMNLHALVSNLTGKTRKVRNHHARDGSRVA